MNAVGGLDDFYGAVYPRLVGLLSAMAGGEDAEAAAQDAFVALIPRWGRVSRYDDPEAWVRQVAVRRLVSRHRRARVALKALPLLGGDAVGRGPDSDRLDVQAALSRLPVDHRAVLVLHHALQMPVEQVAQVLGVPTGTVKSRLSRARAGFAQHYGQGVHAMTDLDQLLAGHVRAAAGSAAAPPLAVLRRRAARRRAARVAAALMSVAAVAAVLAVAGAVPGGFVTDRARVADGAGGDLESYVPSPGVGALAGRVAEVPIGEQRAVTLRFATASGETRAVRTRQGGTWSLELPPGRWTVTAVEGGGVCPGAVTVTAGAWQRNDLLWPCSDSSAPSDEQPSPQQVSPRTSTSRSATARSPSRLT